MIQTLWGKISLIGISKTGSLLQDRANRFANQVNFALLLILTILNCYVIYFFVIQGRGTYDIYGSRLLILQIILLINVWLAYRKSFQAVKAILIFAPVFVIVILPTLLGKVQTSGFFYYHFFSTIFINQQSFFF